MCPQLSCVLHIRVVINMLHKLCYCHIVQRNNWDCKFILRDQNTLAPLYHFLKSYQRLYNRPTSCFLTTIAHVRWYLAARCSRFHTLILYPWIITWWAWRNQEGASVLRCVSGKFKFKKYNFKLKLLFQLWEDSSLSNRAYFAFEEELIRINYSS